MKKVEKEVMDAQALARTYIDEAMDLQSLNGDRQELLESSYEEAVADAEEVFARLLSISRKGDPQRSSVRANGSSPVA